MLLERLEHKACLAAKLPAIKGQSLVVRAPISNGIPAGTGVRCVAAATFVGYALATWVATQGHDVCMPDVAYGLPRYEGKVMR